MNWHPLRLALFALLTLGLTASQSFAAVNKPSAVGRYWRDFKEYWTGAFENQGAVVLVALGAGAVAMFIITRGKWKK
ncbi:hypothetical protein BH11PLA2_BH11PLA2_11810 [soil metagenome]